MRLTLLQAVTLALSLCGTAAAQVGTLVRHDTTNDPCERFKMRVLMPADVSPKSPSENPAGAPDPGIVWNPCRGDVTQVAVVPVIITPGEGITPEQGMSPTAPPFTLPSPPRRSEQPTVLGVKLPPAFEMMRRH
ncbi:MAG: hypothetical protein JOZ96_21265 [Acidobacteria bacterium]|nr:hypothetical protein [Acidobacteriota bacterium]